MRGFITSNNCYVRKRRATLLHSEFVRMESHVEDRLLFNIEKRFTVRRKWIRGLQVAYAVRQLDTDIIRAKVTRANVV